jgi:hypothetical protein
LPRGRSPARANVPPERARDPLRVVRRIDLLIVAADVRFDCRGEGMLVGARWIGEQFDNP